MVEPQVIDFTAKALMLVLVLSMPPILAAALIGTLVSLVQALTQIQDQTLSFAIKLVVVVITIFLTARWLGVELYHFTESLFNSIGVMAR